LPLSAKKWKRHRTASSSENEVKGMDVHLGVEGSNSNGHGEEIDKEGHMMKIIERLQKDAQTHRADNRKLMKARDQQGKFNLKLMQSLERIEKKLDKESDSRKTGSRKTPEKKRRSRSISRHHRHSRNIPIRRHAVVQAHLLPENIGDLEWMN
jgi:hypothetical protein